MLEESIASFQKAIKIYPHHLDAKNNLATLYLKGNYHDQALALLKNILEIHPTYNHALYNLGLTYYLMEKYPDSIRICNSFREHHPEGRRMPECHYYLGRSYGYLKQFDISIRELENAVRLNPEYLQAHISLGKAYGLTNRPDASRKAFLRAYQIQPDDVDVNLNLAINFFKSGEFSRVIPHLETVLSHIPDHPMANNMLTKTRLQLGIPPEEPVKKEGSRK